MTRNNSSYYNQDPHNKLIIIMHIFLLNYHVLAKLSSERAKKASHKTWRPEFQVGVPGTTIYTQFLGLMAFLFNTLHDTTQYVMFMSIQQCINLEIPDTQSMIAYIWFWLRISSEKLYCGNVANMPYRSDCWMILTCDHINHMKPSLL